MKKITIFAAFLLILGVSASIAKAETANSADKVTLEELGVDEAGILPSNPFYFFKSWERDIKRRLTFDPIKKANLELGIINEQIAEAKKMEDVTPEKTNAIIWVIKRYETNLGNFEALLLDLNDNNQNPKVGILINSMLDKLVKHKEVLDELKSNYQDNDGIISESNNAQEKIYTIISIIPEKLETPEEFYSQLNDVIYNQPEISLKDQEIIDILEKVSDNLLGDNYDKIKEMENRLMDKINSEQIMNSSSTPLRSDLNDNGSQIKSSLEIKAE